MASLSRFSGQFLQCRIFFFFYKFLNPHPPPPLHLEINGLDSVVLLIRAVVVILELTLRKVFFTYLHKIRLKGHFFIMFYIYFLFFIFFFSGLFNLIKNDHLDFHAVMGHVIAAADQEQFGK